MRKKEPRLRSTIFPEEYPFTSLHREDLEHLVDLFAKNELPLTIEDKSNEYGSLDEVRQHRGHALSDLKISAGGFGGIAVEGSRLALGLRAPVGSDLRPVWREAREFVQSVTPRWAPLLSLWIWWPLLVIHATLGFLLPDSITRETSWLVVGILVIAGSTFSFALRLTRTRFVLVPRPEAPGFWTRNFDRIVLLVLGTALGTLATLLVQAFRMSSEN